MRTKTSFFGVLRRYPECRRLGLAALVDATGTGLFMATATLFLTRSVGLSGAEIGTGLAVAAAVGLATSVPIGALADRLGAFRVYVLLQLWLASAFVLYTLVHSFSGFVLVASMISIGLCSTVPILQTLVASLVDTKTRVGLMALTRSVNNVGYGLGGALATVVLAVNTRFAYEVVLLSDAASFVIAACLITSMRATRTFNAGTSAGPDTGGGRKKDARRVPARRDPSFFGLVLMNGVLCLYVSLLTVGFPLWVISHTTAPASVVGSLLVVNTAMTVVLQVRLSRDSESLRGARRTFVRAGGVLALSCLVTAAAAVSRSPALAVAVLVAGMALLTLGEIWQAAAQYGSSYALAPPDRRGRYLSVFGLGLNAQRIFGPPLVAIAVSAGVGGWIVLAAVLAIAGVAASYLAGLAKTPQESSESVPVT
jgi:MFS family permease